MFWPRHLRDVPPAQNREHLAGQFRKMLAEKMQLLQVPEDFLKRLSAALAATEERHDESA